jgi:hypothetical protein
MELVHLIRLGRAYVRLIEAAQVLIEYTEMDEERERLEQLVATYQAALRELVGKVPAHVTAEIMAASEKVIGTAGDVHIN